MFAKLRNYFHIAANNFDYFTICKRFSAFLIKLMYIYTVFVESEAKSCTIKEQTERGEKEKNEGQKSFFRKSVTIIWKKILNFAAYFNNRG